jgi:para-aminobenzoate synthetase component 1
MEIAALLAEDAMPFFLDSSDGVYPDDIGRFSYAGSNPFLQFRAVGDSVTITSSCGTHSERGNSLVILGDLLERYRIEPDNTVPGSFHGGAVGFFSYDLVHQLETVPGTNVNDLKIDDINIGFYTTLIVIDNREQSIYAVDCGLAGDAKANVSALVKRLEESRVSIPDHKPVSSTGIHSNFKVKDYLAAIRRIREYILDGEIYQVNLSQRFDIEYTGSPVALYNSLRQQNPAPFGAMLGYDDYWVLSSSPERFIKVSGDRIETRPIKGTAPRGMNKSEDTALAEQLMNSSKDRAEHLMIVDLERNDLSRVSEPGTVKVPDLFRLESYATVHHLVSTVEGKLQPGINSMDCLRATFPGGSITGAPKIRAMEIIDELEPTRRGVYTGSIGYVGFDGSIDLNIAIRTIVHRNGRAWFQGGGGIVWDSDEKSEYEETLQKIESLIQAVIDKK